MSEKEGEKMSKSKTVWDMIQERKDKFKTRKNTFAMFPVGCRAQVITVSQDFNFFAGTEKGTVVKNTRNYLGIRFKFDEPRHFDDGSVQTEFNFSPEDLIRLPDEKEKRRPKERPKVSLPILTFAIQAAMSSPWQDFDTLMKKIVNHLELRGVEVGEAADEKR